MSGSEIYNHIRQISETDDSPMQWITRFYECNLCGYRVKIGSISSQGFAVGNMRKHFRKAHPEVEVSEVA